MWYYAEDKKKIGPLSDVALLKLRSDGKISDATLVWSPKQKVWKNYSVCEVAVKSKRNIHSSDSLERISIISSILRASLMALCIFCGAKIFFTINYINIYVDYVGKDLGMTSIEHTLLRAENKLTNELLSIMLYALFIFVMFVVYKWTYSAAMNSKSLDRNFRFSPTVSAFSYIIPFVNFIFPGKALWQIIKSSRYALGEKPKIFDIFLTGTWWIFWVLTISLIMIRFYGFSYMGNLDKNVALFCFSIYVDSMVICTALIFAVIISHVFSMQNKFFSRDISKMRRTVLSVK